MLSGARRLIVVSGTCLLWFSVGLVGSAVAVPPSPEFLARWDQADRLFATSDLLGAQNALDPLLGQARTLDDGPERRWFASSAARTLAFAGRDAEAAEFLADGRRLENAYLARLAVLESAQPIDGSPAWDGRLAVNGAPVFGTTLAVRLWDLMLGSAVDRAQLAENPRQTCRHPMIGRPYPHTNPTLNPGPILDSPSDLRGHPTHYGPLRNDTSGGSYYVPSYFAGQQPRTLAGCNYLRVLARGGPTGVASSTSKHVVVVPAKEPVVAKRRVQQGAAIRVQAFETRGKKLVVTWRTVGRGARKFVARVTVSDDQAIIRAPKVKGRYDLRLGVGSSSDFATGITDVGVGVAPTTSGSGQSPSRR